MKADVVFMNGEVITVDERNTVVEAVAVKANRIVVVGSNEEVKELIDPHTKVFDLQGKTLLPGIIDSHLHLILYGVNQLAVSCKAEHIHSVEDVLNDLRNKALETPKGEWIRAWGFNETAVKEKRYPTIDELDAISVEHPIIVSRTCGHISVVNHKALKLAQINDNTEDPIGGIIERDERGRLTGRLIEAANMSINEVSNYTHSELRKAVKIASDHFIAAGITSIHDAGGHGSDSYRLLQQAVKDNDILVLHPVRMKRSLQKSKEQPKLTKIK